jgi:hypothetical protein
MANQTPAKTSFRGWFRFWVQFWPVPRTGSGSDSEAGFGSDSEAGFETNSLKFSKFWTSRLGTLEPALKLQVENQANTGKNQEVGFPVQCPTLLPIILPKVHSSTHIEFSQEELELDSINYKSNLSRYP